jgi:hypothetical protein
VQVGAGAGAPRPLFYDAPPSPIVGKREPAQAHTANETPSPLPSSAHEEAASCAADMPLLKFDALFHASGLEVAFSTMFDDFPPPRFFQRAFVSLNRGGGSEFLVDAQNQPPSIPTLKSL